MSDLGGPPGVPLQTWLDNDGRLVATGGTSAGSWWMHWPGLATFSFGTSGAVVARAVRPDRDDAIHDVFTRGVLPVVLLARGWEALHGSAVMLHGAVVGLCAVSGTGKSTMALALTACGARHFADDTIVYRLDHDGPLAARLPAHIRVDSPARAHAGVLADSAPIPPGVEAPLRRVYVLGRDRSIDPRHPEFTLLPAERRFETLLTHAHPFDMGPESRRRAFIDHLLRLAGSIEVWRCTFAPRLEALPQMAEQLYAHARS